jgi:enoyl-CoA hydratase
METLLVERGEKIATLTLNRPEKLNALNQDLLASLGRALAALAQDPPRAVVLTGAGDKAFSAGVDIGELSQMTVAEAKRRSDLGHAICAAIELLPCPVIAAVGGIAVGGGCELSLACDFIYASERAKLGEPEVNIGVIPGFGGTQRLARRVGIGRARELVYTGAIVDAQRALAMGWVNAVVPHEELLPRARAVAEQIAEKPPLAIAQAKRVLLRGVAGDLTAANELEAQAFAGLFGTEDQREGMRAFLEKRKPGFVGR